MIKSLFLSILTLIVYALYPDVSLDTEEKKIKDYMDLSNFSGKLKDILQNYYLINYTSSKSWHDVKSMQLIGTRKKDNKTLGRFTMTKKRPNLLKYKYHSYKDGINLILYDCKEAWIKNPKEDWSNIISDELKLDALFDSHLLNPSEKNKTIELGEKYYIKDSLIQIIIVKLSLNYPKTIDSF